MPGYYGADGTSRPRHGRRHRAAEEDTGAAARIEADCVAATYLRLRFWPVISEPSRDGAGFQRSCSTII